MKKQRDCIARHIIRHPCSYRTIQWQWLQSAFAQ